MTQFSRTPDITSSGDPVGDIAPCHSHAEATLPLKLWLSDDERHHAKADCSNQSEVNKGNHIWTWNHIWRPSWSWLYVRGAFGKKSVINLATPAGLGGRSTTELLLAIDEERLLPAPHYRPARNDLQMTG
jgi:hypothetical protein